MRVYLVCVAVMCKYVGIARKLPGELEVLLVIVLSNALVFDFCEYALGHFAPGCVSDKTALVSVAQSSEGVNRSLDFRYVYLRPDDPRCKSCALVHHGVNFVSLPTVLWAVPV